jgi:hypothetical protein
MLLKPGIETLAVHAGHPLDPSMAVGDRPPHCLFHATDTRKECRIRNTRHASKSSTFLAAVN